MSKFRVVQLTQEALKVQCKVDDFEEWGAPTLDLQQYQRKEELQRATAFSQRGSIFWALMEDNGDAATELVPGRTVLCCHCESHRFDCAVRRSSGEVERGYSHHIGSVFTLPQYRKRGLATFFMKEVAKQLGQLPGALVSVLYSDIGPTYYDKLGWKLHPSKMATLDVAHPRNAKSVEESQVEVESLFLDGKLDAILQADNARLVDELSSERFQGGEAFAVLPARDSLEWQFCIGVHFARVRAHDELPSRCGVKIDENAFVIWCHNLKQSTLYVVRARFPEAGENAAKQTQLLLSTALEEARKFKLKKVAIWDPPSALLREEVRSRLEIEVGEREDSLSSAMVFRRGNDGAEGNSAAPLPRWLGNENWNPAIVDVCSIPPDLHLHDGQVPPGAVDAGGAQGAVQDRRPGAPLLDVQQWQQKDEVQRATRFSQDGALFWALVDKPEGNPTTLSDSGLVAGRDLLYCHCKTLRFPCVYRRSSGEIERGYSYQISSVYTLPEFRKRGLAGFFLTEVAKQLEQLPQTLVSVLYSDVGPTFYDKLGWKCHPSKMATLEVDHPRNAKAVGNNNGSNELETLLLDHKLEKFLEADNARLVDELSSEKFQGRDAFLILPTRDSIEWQFVNGVHYARVAGFDELPSRGGVRINDDAFVLWWHNLKESTLYVDRARFPDSGDNAVETTRVLLDAAMQEARKFKLMKVVIWDPPSGLLRDKVHRLVEIGVADRKLSLSSAMVFYHGNVDESKATALPHWFCNEKYAWV